MKGLILFSFLLLPGADQDRFVGKYTCEQGYYTHIVELTDDGHIKEYFVNESFEQTQKEKIAKYQIANDTMRVYYLEESIGLESLYFVRETEKLISLVPIALNNEWTKQNAVLFHTEDKALFESQACRSCAEMRSFVLLK